MSRVIMSGDGEDFRPLKPLNLKPNPKALKSPSSPPAVEGGVLKVTADVKDSLVQKVERAPQLRRCAICQELKPLTEYHTNRARKDNLDARCKSCTKRYKVSLKARRDAGEVIRRRGKVAGVQTAALLPNPEPQPLPSGTEVATSNKVMLNQEQILARGAEIQRAVATAEVIAAVSLLLGMERSASDTVIRMVQAFYTTTGE